MEKSVVVKMMFRAMQMHRQDPNYSSRHIVEFLVTLRKCRSVFKLLELERNSFISRETSERAVKAVDPHLTWSVNNISDCFYK